MLRAAADPDEKLRMFTNYDERQRTTADQKDDVLDYNPEVEEGKDSELPQVTKVMDPFEDFADAGYNLRVLAGEADLGSHIDPEAAAMIKQDDCVGGGDEDNVVDRLLMKEVWEDGRPTYDGTVAKMMALGGVKVKQVKVKVTDHDQGHRSRSLIKVTDQGQG